MAKDVFANGMEISCKAGDNKVISAFPDVCLSPPSPPAGPIPIPYPLFSFSKDTTSGSKSVKISRKEVILKDKSYYKKCTGDEAATKSFGQGTATHTITGKVYFISWAMDVEIEGENVVRHLDMTTSNHSSPLPNEAASIPGIESMSKDVLKKCDATYEKYKLRRHGAKPGCGSGKQSHHPAMNACFEFPRGNPTIPGYKGSKAPAICLEDSHKDTIHYDCTQAQNAWAKNLKKQPKYKDLRAKSKEILKEEAGMTEKEAECIMKLVDAYMETINVSSNTPLRIPG